MCLPFYNWYLIPIISDSLLFTCPTCSQKTIIVPLLGAWLGSPMKSEIVFFLKIMSLLFFFFLGRFYICCCVILWRTCLCEVHLSQLVSTVGMGGGRSSKCVLCMQSTELNYFHSKNQLWWRSVGKKMTASDKYSLSRINTKGKNIKCCAVCLITGKTKLVIVD